MVQAFRVVARPTLLKIYRQQPRDVGSALSVYFVPRESNRRYALTIDFMIAPRSALGVFLESSVCESVSL